MNLFVNAISKNAYIALFDDKRDILDAKYFEIKGNESSLFISIIDKFLKKNKLSYFDLKNIVAVNGPGSFTGARTIVLTINTIAFVVNNSDLTQSSPCKGEVKTISPFYLQNDILPPLQGGTKGGLCLTPVSYFDLYNDYPIIKSSSKRDSFFKKNKNSPIEVIYNNELEELLKNENIKSIYGEGDIKNSEIIEKIDYVNIIKNIKFEKFSKIETLYIKKPNIF